MRKAVIAIFLLAILGAAVFWFVTAPKTVDPASLQPYTPNAVSGKAMFFAGGCAACHAIPGDEDRSKLGGGLALKSPFGTFYAPNISSDAKDGIGAWTEAQFVTAMTKGTSPQGTHYFPAFPYTSYHLLAVPDLRDLFAHIKTLPAIQGRVRDHDVPFPFNIRRLVGGWKFLFLRDRPFAHDIKQTMQWNRGAYLVNAAGHCAECHSPRNFLGAIVQGQRFAGGPNPEGEGWIPNITQAALKDWSVDDFVQLLEFGDKPSGKPILGSMVPVVRNTEQLPPEDRLAMAVYLKSLPAIEGPKRPERK
jgi:mono/diheme cytochrome c family protein